MRLTDTHAHLDLPEFKDDLDEVLQRAADAGVEKIITVGIDAFSSTKATVLAERYAAIFAAVGIHPCDSSEATAEDLKTITDLSDRPKVVAIGETGLDFYHRPFSAETQRRYLEFHLKLAAETRLPVIIHSRNADEAMVPLLTEWSRRYPEHIKGVIHCFNSDLATAEKYLEAGFYIALGGYVSYPSARKSHEVFRSIPLDRLLLETDCPFLPPQAFRGQRNEPSYIKYTAGALATLRDLPINELASKVADNSRRLFGLDQ